MSFKPKIDIAFLFALPISIQIERPGQQHGFQRVDEINWQHELSNIKKLLKEFNLNVNILSKPATKANLV